MNGAGNKKWEVSNIRQVLTNEKSIGDALLQKTCTVSVLEKKRIKDDGQVPKCYAEGSYEVIIDRDVFLRVQAEIDRRANIIKGGKKRVLQFKVCVFQCYLLQALRRYFPLKTPDEIVNRTFVQMMEKLGYDIELTYKKR